jgi:hypothetical protein
MSETTEDLQGTAPTPDAEPAAEPQAHERIVPAITSLPDEVAAILAFHGTPVAAQALREVLGMLGRTAGDAARRMPKNRPAELRAKGWEKASLLALAELCKLLAPEVGTINAPSDPDLFPDATSPAPGDIEAQRAELESHRAQVVRELAAKQAQLAEGNGGMVVASETLGPDLVSPFIEPTAVEVLTEQLGAEAIPEDTITGYPNAYVLNGEVLWHRPDQPADDEGEATSLPVFHRPDPVPANAEESRSLIGREQGAPPF